MNVEDRTGDGEIVKTIEVSIENIAAFVAAAECGKDFSAKRPEKAAYRLFSACFEDVDRLDAVLLDGLIGYIRLLHLAAADHPRGKAMLRCKVPDPESVG